MVKQLAGIKKVGITGAAGNIGTTLRAGLRGYELRLFDRVAGAALTKIDLADRGALKGAFDGLDALVHLAGDPRPDAPRADTYRNNFEAASYVFEEARSAGVKKIVYASSNFYHEAAIGRVLDGSSKELITLDMPPSPVCLYGESKVYGEALGRHLAYCGVKFAALRIGWTVPQDDPSLYGGRYMRAVFCSKRDLVQAFDKALLADAGFLAAFATSANTHNVFDLEGTRKILGFAPQDNAEDYFSAG